MSVFENQCHPLLGNSKLGGMDCHDYVFDWLLAFFRKKETDPTRPDLVHQGARRRALGELRLDTAGQTGSGLFLISGPPPPIKKRSVERFF